MTGRVLACGRDARIGRPSRRVVVGTFREAGGPGTAPFRGLAGCRESRVEGRSGSVVVAER